MKKQPFLMLSIAIFFLLQSCGSNTKSEPRKDGPYPVTFGQLFFSQTNEGTFCPCDGGDCLTMTGEIQFKALRSIWWNYQKDGETKVFGNLGGYYFSTKDSNGKQVGNLTIESFALDRNHDCDGNSL